MTTVTEAESSAREQVPFYEWDEFLLRYFRWIQGEHVALIGPTGSGKTSLMLRILALRAFVVVLATKPRDKTLSALVKHGFRRMKKWDPALSPRKYPKRLLWPDASKMYSAHTQQAEFVATLDAIYRVGYWCVCVDELWYLIHHLKMSFEVKTYLQQARSLKISLLVGTQRPAHVPVEIYDQSSHLFFWLDNDETNLKRISGISYRSSHLIRDVVSSLEKHEVLYIHRDTGFMCRTMAPPPEKGAAA
jgi:hypothetical protein